MTELTLFLSSFLLVFALGLQSLNVNGGHYVAAFFTSFMIGGGNLVVLKLAPNASVPEMAAYMMGGPFGIICSMIFHAYAKRTLRWLRTKPRRSQQCTHITQKQNFHGSSQNNSIPQQQPQRKKA